MLVTLNLLAPPLSPTEKMFEIHRARARWRQPPGPFMGRSCRGLIHDARLLALPPNFPLTVPWNRFSVGERASRPPLSARHS